MKKPVKKKKSCNGAAAFFLRLVYQEPFLPVRSAAQTRSRLSSAAQVHFVFNPNCQLVSTVSKCQCHQSVHAITPSPPSWITVSGVQSNAMEAAEGAPLPASALCSSTVCVPLHRTDFPRLMQVWPRTAAGDADGRGQRVGGSTSAPPWVPRGEPQHMTRV